MDARWRLASGGGAIGVFDLVGEPAQIRSSLALLGGNKHRAGDVWLADLFGIDQGVVAWVDEEHVQLMPHGGVAVLTGIAEQLEEFATEVSEETPWEMFPEAQDQIEACMLAAISQSASPRALDVIATHADRWRNGADEMPHDDQQVLSRLVEPPLVVAVGAPNIGKSSLLNALAGRTVAIAGNEAGTTRDRVGAVLTLDGLTVRWLDLPGFESTESSIDRAAINAGLTAASHADLVIHCLNERGEGADLPEELAALEMVSAVLRGDLQSMPHNQETIITSARHNEGLHELANEIRERLLPERVLTAPGCWKFHPILG